MKRILKTALTLFFFLGFFTSAQVLSSVLKKQKDIPREGGVLRIRSYSQDFNPTFDPASVSPHYFITEQLFDGLIKFDNNFNIQPALAEYWKPPDLQNRTLFYLRKKVRFHHGRELTAEDVKFSLERLIRSQNGNNAYQYFINKVVGAEEFREGRAPDVSGFKAVDKHVFSIQWKKPFAFASGLYLLGMYYCKILPKDLVEDQGRNFFQKPIGTGPFKFEHWLRSPKLEVLGVRLERNEEYFGGKPYLDALEYSPHFSEDQFQQGLVQISPPTSRSLLREDRYRILENTSLRTAYLVMSCHIPPLDDPDFRKALALGLNKAALADAARSTAQVPQIMQNYIPPVFPGFVPRDTSILFDPEKSRMLLDRLLAESGRQGLTLTFLAPYRAQPLYSNIFSELRRDLEPLGIDLEMRSLRRDEDILNIREPYLKLLEWEMDFPDAENIIHPLFQSRSPVNRLNCRYENPQLDTLLEQTEVERSWEKRTALFRKMEKILYAEIPAIPLYNIRVRISLLPTVRGAKLPALGFLFLDAKRIWLEE